LQGKPFLNIDPARHSGESTAHFGGQARTETTIKQGEEYRGKHQESMSFPAFCAIGESAISKYTQGR
jgi:hypothetical protein